MSRIGQDVGVTSPGTLVLLPDQDRTRRFRIANIGASTDFSSVSPVLPGRDAASW